MCGCDIHMFCEEYYEDSWHLVSDNKGPISIYWDEKKAENNHNKKHDWDVHRNYFLFAVLAGVRNYDEISLIKDPAGFPEDSSDELKKEYESWEGDAHTPSFFTLKELLDLSDMTFPKEIAVDVKGFIEYKKGIIPNDLEFSCYYENSDKFISNEEMERLSKLVPFWDDRKVYTKLTVDFPYKKVSTHLWDNIVPAMQKLQEDPNNVRLVFWFDN